MKTFLLILLFVVTADASQFLRDGEFDCRLVDEFAQEIMEIRQDDYMPEDKLVSSFPEAATIERHIVKIAYTGVVRETSFQKEAQVSMFGFYWHNGCLSLGTDFRDLGS